jgi:hypothetical protein
LDTRICIIIEEKKLVQDHVQVEVLVQIFGCFVFG